MHLEYDTAASILAKSETLYTGDEILIRIKQIAVILDKEIKHKMPLFLTVMNGGMFFTTSLLKYVSNPFFIDYIHASRYHNQNSGSKNITWHRCPSQAEIQGKTIYIIDDVLDEGYTLWEIKKFLMDNGAKECKIVVLIDKEVDTFKPIMPDIYGLKAPNKFLFGFGMDIKGLYRQLGDIRIYNE